jgi:hypothetical protein
MGEALPQPPANRTRRVTRDTERQSEIILANDLPAFARRHGPRCLTRNIPAVVLETADQAVAGSSQKPVLLEIGDVIFEQYEARAPAGEIKSGEHFEFVTLDIDGQEIEPDRRVGLRQNIVERSHRYFDGSLRLRTRCHSVAIERR